jgi:hypothetical protein
MGLEFVWWILVGSDRVEIDDFVVACGCISGGSQTSEHPREGKEREREQLRVLVLFWGIGGRNVIGESGEKPKKTDGSWAWAWTFGCGGWGTRTRTRSNCDVSVRIVSWVAKTVFGEMSRDDLTRVFTENCDPKDVEYWLF